VAKVYSKSTRSQCGKRITPDWGFREDFCDNPALVTFDDLVGSPDFDWVLSFPSLIDSSFKILASRLGGVEVESVIRLGSEPSLLI
jgi:hypothetical protein